MSMFYYIGSNKELPEGSFGSIQNGKDESTTKVTTIIGGETYYDLSKMSNICNQNGKVFEIEDQIKIINKLEKETKDFEIYSNIEDAAGIYVKQIIFTDDEEILELRKVLKTKNIYEVSPNFGSFDLGEVDKEISNEIDIEAQKVNKKCMLELFKYIEKNIDFNNDIEFYTCWSSDISKGRDKDLDRILNIKDIEISKDFNFNSREYIVFKK